MLRMGRTFKNEVPPKDSSAVPNAVPANTFNANAANVVPASSTTQTTPSVRPDNAAPQRAVTESEALARDIREGILNGFVGATTVLNGDAEFKGMLRIDGRLTGRINSEKGTLIISAGGNVEANIAVATAKINGTVKGDITASERIEFGRTARIRGNIRTPALVIEQGAVFEGNCRMEQNVTAESKPRSAQAQPRKIADRDRSLEKETRVPIPDKVIATSPPAAVVNVAE